MAEFKVDTKWLISGILAVLVSVVSFFGARLVADQDKNTDTLHDIEKKLERIEVKVEMMYGGDPLGSE